MLVDPRHYTCAEIAATVGVDVDTVRAWIARGDLPAMNVAKTGLGRKPRWRVAESALADFLKQRGQRTPASSPARRPRRAPPKPSGPRLRFF